MILENLYLSEEEYELLNRIRSKTKRVQTSREEMKAKSNLLSELEKRGYVKTEENSTNRGPSKRVYITSEGKTEIKNYENTVWARKHKILGGLYRLVQEITGR